MRLGQSIRRAWRAVAFLIHLCLGLALASLLALRYGSTWYGVPGGARAMRWWMVRLVHILGLRLRVTGRPAVGPVLMAANHISWLDIVVIMSRRPAVFVAKDSVRGWPAIGLLARLAGTVFLDRNSKNALGNAVDVLAAALRADLPVAVFPEGTTSDGRSVSKFHAGLFQAAVEVGCPVQPVALRYHAIGPGENPAPFVGDAAFVGHLWRVLGAEGIAVELDFCHPVAAAAHRRHLAQSAQNRIEKIVQGVPSYANAA